jgi:hypothetical protein
VAGEVLARSVIEGLTSKIHGEKVVDEKVPIDILVCNQQELPRGQRSLVPCEQTTEIRKHFIALFILGETGFLPSPGTHYFAGKRPNSNA